MNYSVLNPHGIPKDIAIVPISPRLDDLKGKIIYFVTQDRPKLSTAFAKRLGEKLPDTTIVYREKPSWVGDDDLDLRNEVLKKADAMIYGTCMGGSSGMYAVSWIKEVEKHGIPSLYLVGEMYMPDIENTCKTQGFPAMRRVEVPIVWDQYIFEDISEKRFDKVTSDIIDALTSPLTDEEKRTAPLVGEKQNRIVCTGTLAEIQSYFIENELTDGLPVIPPTEEAVREMLSGTSHQPDEVITESMLPEQLVVTVEKVAIVGVMAGCKPGYMPALLAIIDAFSSNPGFIHTVGSDSSFSIMTIINGPVRNEIGMNTGSNAIGPGNQANASIGRFLRMAIINLGGVRVGITDLSAQGNPMKYGFCFPENEEKNPWEPYHVSMGFKVEESTVTLVAGGWCHWSFSGDLDLLAKAVASFWMGSAMILLAPDAAEYYSRKKMSKSDIEKYIVEQALKQNYDFTAKWLGFGQPFARKDDEEGPRQMRDLLAKVLVVGGQTSQQVAQAWHAIQPITTGIDKWR